jgi:hypothetical protein
MNASASICGLLAIAMASAFPAAAQGLDGTWRGTTSGTPSGGNCRPFTFDIAIRSGAASGAATSPHGGAPLRWAVSGVASGDRIVLLAESSDPRARRPTTRWRGERRGNELRLEQIGSDACNPPRSGVLRRA